MPKVSIIVPVYNVEVYLEKCLDSLVNQTLKDIEIIIVNDGSPDNSQKIIDKYQKKYKNIKAYLKENGGLSDARNYGIKKANGEYLSFVDSDDYIDTTMLEKMYKLAKKENLDLVVCNTINIDDTGNGIEINSNYNYSDDTIKNYLLSPPMACIRIYKKELFKNIKFKKGIYYEDLELTPKLVKYTKKIGFIDEGLYYYYQRVGSIMKQKEFNNKLLDIFDVLETNKLELLKEYPDEVEYMYITHLLRTSTLRFLEYDNYKELINKITNTMKCYFPNWNKNKYYQKSSKKLKLICTLAYHKNIFILKLIKKITNK